MAVAPLRALHDAGHAIGLVVTRADARRGRGTTLSPSPVKAAAMELGLPVTDRVDDVLDAGVDLGVVVAFGQIIRPHVLDGVPMVNLHFSDLPRWRGAAPVERAILAGDEHTAVCLMDVEEGLDTGGVRARAGLDIGPDETAAELRVRLVDAGTHLLVDALRDGLPPAEAQHGEVTYARKITPGDLELDWARPALELHRVVRVGGAHTTFRGRASRSGERACSTPIRPPRHRASWWDWPWRRVTAGSSWSRCSPRAGPGRRRPIGCGGSVCRPRASGSVPDRAGRSARAVALEALIRVERDGAYANLVLASVLGRSDLSSRDRAFATELVYGAIRRRRSCDWLVDRFLSRDPDPTTRSVLRLGAYQLAFLDTPPHAAVSATVALAPGRTRGLVNAVLRRVSEAPRDWPDEATRLSYPDWIVEALRADLGDDVAVAALAAMNERAGAVQRDDGYHQDPASQWVTEVVGAGPGDLVVDVCAGPGGKATGMAASGATVVALELHPARARLVAENAAVLGSTHVAVVAADARRAPLVAGRADRVLVDAPCSGLGSLRRRADARWRIQADDVERLVVLQREVLDAAVALVRPGGELVFSVCTLTAAETTGVDEWLADAHPELEAREPGARSRPGPCRTAAAACCCRRPPAPTACSC